MTISTFFPDADPEVTSVDGNTSRDSQSVAWTTLRDGAGIEASPSGPTGDALVTADAVTNNWRNMRRTFFLFDTSSIPDGDIIDSATFEFTSGAKQTALLPAGSISMVTSTPASNTNLVPADHVQLGTTKQATDLTLASITSDNATFNVFTLNATGLGNVSKTGISKFGVRMTSDNDNAEPTWATGNPSHSCDFNMAEEIVAGDKRPKLVVTHTTPDPFPVAYQKRIQFYR